MTSTQGTSHHQLSCCPLSCSLQTKDIALGSLQINLTLTAICTMYVKPKNSVLGKSGNPNILKTEHSTKYRVSNLKLPFSFRLVWTYG